MRPAATVFSRALIAALLPVYAGSAQAGPASDAIAVCPSAIQRREILHDERGQPIHISPDALASRAGALLLAGQFSATFGPTPRASIGLTSQDSILALLRLPNGEIHTFPRPPLGEWEIDDVLAAPVGASDWAVVITTDRDSARNAPSLRGPVWYMRLSAEGVRTVQQLSLPPGIKTNGYAPGDVAHRDGRVVFALPASDRDGNSLVVLLEQREDRWESRVVTTDGVAWVAVGFDGAKGDLALVLVKPDVTQRVDFNSLFLVRPDRRGNVFERLATGGNQPIHQPSVASTPTGLVVGWHRRQVRMSTGGLYQSFVSLVEHDAVRAPREVGDKAPRVRAVGSDGQPAHVVLVRAAQADSSEIDIFAPATRDTPVRVHVATAGAHAMRAVQDGTRIVVTQPRVLGGGTHLASELLWISTRCEAPEGGKMKPGA